MATTSQPGWELKRDKNGIVIYTRESPGNRLKEYRVIAGIDSPIKDVYNFLIDLEKRPAWVIKYTGLEIIDTVGDYSLSVLAGSSPPFPQPALAFIFSSNFCFQ